MMGAIEVVKLKRGRPKLPSKARYRDGRIKRAEYRTDPRAVAIAGRMRVYGVTEQQAKDVSRWTLDGVLTRIGVTGLEGRRQRETAIAFAEFHAAYAEAILAPRATPQSNAAVMVARRGGVAPAPLPDDTDDREAARRRLEARMRDVVEALAEVDRRNCSSGVTATSLMWRVCIQEQTDYLTPYELGVFREGLNAIRRLV